MKITKFSFFILLFLFTTSVVDAQGFNKAGRTAFQFIKIGIGARQAALGEASIARVRDVNAVFWNPANITGIELGEASFSYTRWFADLDYFAGAAGIRWNGVGVFALSYASLNYGELQEALVTSATGSSDTRTGVTFTGGDLLLGFSFSREFTENLSIGITAKILQEKLFTYKVSLFAYDIGTNYDVGYKGMRLAMSFQNFGPSAKWLEQSDREEGYDIPLIFRIGLSANVISGEDGFFDVGQEHRLIVSTEAVHTNDYAERLHIGAEYLFSEFLAIRGGYRFNYEEGNWSLGLGFMQNVANITVSVDYSYVGYRFLNSPHRVTVSFRF